MDTLEERLEGNEIVSFAPCPFPLPVEAERAFLFQQREGGLTHKHISLDPRSGLLTGFVWQSAEQAARLRLILQRFSGAAEAWLTQLLPQYVRGWRKDRISFRCEEEATRRLRQNARNDLLHIDAFPSRPTGGDRILRLFVNLHPSEARVWVTSDPFAELLSRFGGEVNRLVDRWNWKVRRGILKIFGRLSQYDEFMVRLHQFLKRNEEYQDRARRKILRFAPGTAWLAFTDGLCHAELRGRFALEHSYFVSQRSLVHPERAPFALWQQNRQPLAA